MAGQPREPSLLDRLQALKIEPGQSGMAYALPIDLRDALIEDQMRRVDDGK